MKSFFREKTWEEEKEEELDKHIGEIWKTKKVKEFVEYSQSVAMIDFRRLRHRFVKWKYGYWKVIK